MGAKSNHDASRIETDAGSDEHPGVRTAWYLRSAVLVPTVFLIVVGCWESVVRIFKIPSYVLPTPREIAQAFMGAIQSVAFWQDAQATVIEMIAGFVGGAVLALVLGLAVSQIRLFELALMPYIVAFQAVPKTALAPLFLIWFGFGLTSKVMTAGLAAFFPILITVIEGLNSTDKSYIDMMRSFKASTWQIFRYAKLPSAAPFIFAGLNIGIIFALIGAVVGEFVGAQRGLGYRVLQSNFTFDIAGLFATLVALSITGLIPYYLLRLVQRRLIFWTKVERGVGA